MKIDEHEQTILPYLNKFHNCEEISLRPEGNGYGLKCIESKNQQHFDLKNFLRPSTLFLCEKKYFFVKKKQRKVNFISFSFLELKPTRLGQNMMTYTSCKKNTNILLRLKDHQKISTYNIAKQTNFRTGFLEPSKCQKEQSQELLFT